MPYASTPIARALRRPRWRQALLWVQARWLSLANAAALVVLGLALLTAPQFQVEQVTVRRQSPSAQEAITRATQLSQVVGHNIFLVNTNRVAREVALVPSVLHARVIPQLPNVVEIEIVERVPVARWHAANGSFLVDDQGVVVAEAMASATGSATSGPPGWPAALTVRDTTGRDVRPGDRVEQRALLAARELARALPAAGAGVKEVEYSPQGLVFVTDGGWRVIVGETEALNAKLANLAAIVELARAQDLKLVVVDLRPKERPFYQVAP